MNVLSANISCRLSFAYNGIQSAISLLGQRQDSRLKFGDAEKKPNIIYVRGGRVA